jgi:triphosphatase
MDPRKVTDTSEQASSTESLPARPAAKAKAERGYKRIEHGKPSFKKATSPELDPRMSCAEAFRLITCSCLRQIVANEPGMLAGHAEALHQFRIGLRRLRAAVKSFTEMTADAQRETIKAELKWVMKQVGPARDLDVFGADVLTPLARGHDPHLAAAHRSYNEMRKQAHETATSSIRSGRFRKLSQELAEWAEAGPWTTNPTLEELRERRIAEHAAEVLGRWRRSFRKRCRKLGDLSPKQRHGLRMRAKDLRYATEFFVSLFPRHIKRREATLAALENLQNTLGALNDLTARKRIMPKEINQSAHARRVIAAQEAKAGQLLKRAKVACTKFGEVKPFWN